jgi:hypothetical protein
MPRKAVKLTATLVASTRPAEIGFASAQTGGVMSNEDDGASRPMPDGNARVPFGVWLMLGIFVVGLIALFVLGNMDWFV